MGWRNIAREVIARIRVPKGKDIELGGKTVSKSVSFQLEFLQNDMDVVRGAMAKSFLEGQAWLDEMHWQERIKV